MVALGLTSSRIEKGPDPPDVIVRGDGSSSLGIEVTEYHPERNRVGMETRAGQFRRTLDTLVETRPSLRKGAGILIVWTGNRDLG